MKKQFGEWTVIAEAGSKGKNYKKRYVLARCKCGVEKVVQFANLTNGLSKRCWKCGYKVRAKKNKSRGDKSGIVNKKCAYGRYKQGAKKRGLDFLITLDNFLEISSKNCHYCGLSPSNCYFLKHSKGNLKGKPRAGKPFIHNGIDRINSNKGYEKINCVPCCKRCNVAKNNMSEPEFYDWIKRVCNHCAQRIK